MTLTTDILSEEDNSVTLQINCKEYLVAFVKFNSTTEPDSFTEVEFKKGKKELENNFGTVNEMARVSLVEKLYDAALKSYSSDEQDVIRNTPKVESLLNSTIELINNSIDEFLLEHLENNQPTYETPLLFNLKIELTADEVTLTFQDNGPGFEDVDGLNGIDNQLQYIQTHKSSKKREIQNRNAPIQGLLGGRALGLRQLICQILTGEKLRLGGDSPMPSEKTNFSNNQSPIQFGKGIGQFCGAKITITTPITPVANTSFTQEESESSPIFHLPSENGLPSLSNLSFLSPQNSPRKKQKHRNLTENQPSPW